LVNANSKLQNITMQTPERSFLGHYVRSVNTAVDAIFHVPKEVQDQTPLIPSVPARDIAASGPSSEFGEDSNVLQEPFPIGLDSPAADVNEEGYSDFADDFEEDDEPDTINGLTVPEMRTVLQQVSDGTISDHERAEAAMLMLGMAGGELIAPYHSTFLSDS
jgi:hypothetical protein